MYVVNIKTMYMVFYVICFEGFLQFDWIIFLIICVILYVMYTDIQINPVKIVVVDYK